MADKLRFENVSFRGHSNMILNKISFSLRKGETLVITGRSGTGKSTLLEIAAGLTRPYEGNVYWDDVLLDSLSTDQKIAARKKMGYLFQKHALIHNYPIIESIALPLRYHTSLNDRLTRERARKQLERYGIADIAGKLPDHLSVVQARYAALARAMIMEPQFLLLDEPLSGMDPYACEKLVMIIKTIQETRSPALLIVCNSAHAFSSMDCREKLLDNGILLDAEFRGVMK
ncbi:MAG: ATP-binding cassette domain-containing protein [Chitinivibrionales bacterium]|nr:ATP-binding cassette domain-containing protein [Chitinivibrionales bacterium]